MGSNVKKDISENLHEIELKEPVQLCDSKGLLNDSAVGWSRYPLHSCNITGHSLRKKKWNYWLITTDKYLFSITISNIDYAGLVFGYFYNLQTGKFIEKTVITPFGKGCRMPDGTRKPIEFKYRDMNVSFAEEGEFTKIHVDSSKFGDSSLEAEFFIEHPKCHETLNVVIPWSKKQFQFTAKENCYPTYGNVKLGEEVYEFGLGKSFASLDYGRGVWPRKIFWNWATCSGISDGNTVGLNLGSGWTDGTGMTENAILFNGKISKISDKMLYDYDRNNIMKPWKIKTQNSKRVEITFTPFYERIAKTNFGLIKSEIHQLFGYFSGEIVTDDSKVVLLDKIMGCAEDHDAKW